MISYLDNAENLKAYQLQGFLTHWLNTPSANTLLRILQSSDLVVIAYDKESDQVIGYITAITDGISCAYIPHLEVRQKMRAEGIGSELVTRMLAKLRHLYMIDLMCDPELQPFYARLGFRESTGMMIRNHDRQLCE